jgi:mannose-1-phosphate guanylyltransferase
MTEAVVLVGGRGTRLRPLTVNTPKPLLSVAGVPFLAHVFARIRDAGITHVVLATSYRAEVFEQTFGNGSRYGIELEYVTETSPLDTAGAIRNVVPALRGGPEDPVLVLNGDILSGHDIAGQIRAHLDRGADVTLHLIEVEDARAFGCVPIDADGRVTAFLEKMPEPVTNLVNAGSYVFRRSVIDSIPTGRPVSVERETFPDLLAAGALVLGHVESTYWRDLGTPAAYVGGSRDLVLGIVGSGALPGETGQALVDPTAVVDATAQVHGGSVIGAEAVIAAGAVVDASVVLEGAQIAAGAVVRRSLIGERAVVGSDTTVADGVVGDDADLGSDNEFREGIRVWTSAVIPDRSIRFSSDS